MLEDKPVFLLDDDMTDFGAGVVKSIFPNATDEECRTAAAGAFMAILAFREGDNVLFGYSEEGPFFAFQTDMMRGRQ